MLVRLRDEHDKDEGAFAEVLDLSWKGERNCLMQYANQLTAGVVRLPEYEAIDIAQTWPWSLFNTACQRPRLSQSAPPAVGPSI